MLERLQVSPADQVDAPDFHPYVVVYHLTDAQEAKLKELIELANQYNKAKNEDFSETPSDFFQSRLRIGSKHHIDDVFSHLEHAYRNFFASRQNEGLEDIQHDT